MRTMLTISCGALLAACGAPTITSGGDTELDAPGTLVNETRGVEAAISVADVMSRAKSVVGFSYHWGSGCWDPTSTHMGACYGSCPNCSHTGSWGSDCSGFVAKAWQVPGPEPTTTCDHPYSTIDFHDGHNHWSDVARSSVKQGDALVHHDNGSGHIFLYDSGDGWGWMSAYECKGCSYGCIKDTRSATSNYKAIRRAGL